MTKIYLSTFKDYKSGEDATLIYKTAEDASRFLIWTLRKWWDEDVNGADDPNYQKALKKLTADEIRKDGNVKVEIGDYVVWCEYISHEEILHRVLYNINDHAVLLHNH